MCFCSWWPADKRIQPYVQKNKSLNSKKPTGMRSCGKVLSVSCYLVWQKSSITFSNSIFSLLQFCCVSVSVGVISRYSEPQPKAWTNSSWSGTGLFPGDGSAEGPRDPLQERVRFTDGERGWLWVNLGPQERIRDVKTLTFRKGFTLLLKSNNST